jgi:hypothetical protein
MNDKINLIYTSILIIIAAIIISFMPRERYPREFPGEDGEPIVVIDCESDIDCMTKYPWLWDENHFQDSDQPDFFGEPEK